MKNRRRANSRERDVIRQSEKPAEEQLGQWGRGQEEEGRGRREKRKREKN